MKKKREVRLPIHEVFGPTIQGEGMVVGQKTMFVRTGGCDYSCAWCDSAFTWNGEQKADMLTVHDIFDRIEEAGKTKDGKRNYEHVTISGGNPALLKGLGDLIDILQSYGIKVGLETQGSKWQDWFYKIDDLTISPKPPSSLMKTDFTILDEIIAKLDESNVNFSLKVVVFDDKDFEYAKKVNYRYRHLYDVFYLSVGNEDSHEQGNIAPRLIEKLDWLWDKVFEEPEMNNARPLPQLHTLVYNNRRGV